MIPTAGNRGIRASVACVNLKWMCVSVMTQLFVHHYKNTKADSFLAAKLPLFSPPPAKPVCTRPRREYGKCGAKGGGDEAASTPGEPECDESARSAPPPRQTPRYLSLAVYLSSLSRGACQRRRQRVHRHFFSAPHHLSPSRCL